jgi:hypothetical protein
MCHSANKTTAQSTKQRLASLVSVGWKQTSLWVLHPGQRVDAGVSKSNRVHPIGYVPDPLLSICVWQNLPTSHPLRWAKQKLANLAPAFSQFPLHSMASKRGFPSSPCAWLQTMHVSLYDLMVSTPSPHTVTMFQIIFAWHGTWRQGEWILLPPDIIGNY